MTARAATHSPPASPSSTWRCVDTFDERSEPDGETAIVADRRDQLAGTAGNLVTGQGLRQEPPVAAGERDPSQHLRVGTFMCGAVELKRAIRAGQAALLGSEIKLLDAIRDHDVVQRLHDLALRCRVMGTGEDVARLLQERRERADRARVRRAQRLSRLP